ncbi:hypothetical protein SNE40_000725 [Patella caerulea]|uniref:Sulfotransferase domain-containing protein n=1 Tax=Patella caerulea TaxID=87958 RepID=A0AAN8K5Q9_PATCE
MADSVELVPGKHVQDYGYRHVLPGEHVYDGVLFFGYSPPDILDAVKNFRVRDDDVFIVSYPKAGTTWMQEILWLVVHDGDFETASKTPIYFRSPFLEFKDLTLNEVGLDIAHGMRSPRVIKSHLPFRLMPKKLDKSKVVVVFRNPKDVSVSYYNFYKSSSSFGDFTGTWRDFLIMFLTGKVDHGSWFDFTISWWKRRHEPNVLLVFYEDMKRNLKGEIRKIANFIGKHDLSEDVITRIANHCTFDNMKKNPMTNHEDVYSINSKISPLLRKGKIGDWKNQYSVSQNEDFDAVYKEKMKDIDIPFRYEWKRSTSSEKP